MTQKRSNIALAAAILGLLYGIYILYDFSKITGSSQSTVVLATVMFLPHIIFAILAALFGILGWAIPLRGLVLTAGILYCIAIVLLFRSAPYIILQMILSFVGFAHMKPEGYRSADKREEVLQ